MITEEQPIKDSAFYFYYYLFIFIVESMSPFCFLDKGKQLKISKHYIITLLVLFSDNMKANCSE